MGLFGTNNNLNLFVELLLTPADQAQGPWARRRCAPYSLPLASREWKNGSNSSCNCTPFLHSLLTKGKTGAGRNFDGLTLNVDRRFRIWPEALGFADLWMLLCNGWTS